MRPTRDAPLAWQMRSKGEQIKKQPDHYNVKHDAAHFNVDALQCISLLPGQPRNALAHAAVQILLNSPEPIPRPDLVETLKTKTGFSPAECRRMIDTLVLFGALVQVIDDEGVVFVELAEVAQ